MNRRSLIATTVAAALGGLMAVGSAVLWAHPTAAQGFDVVEATIAQVHAAMEDGALTCRGLVESYMARIDAYDQAGPRLNAVQTVNPRALEIADSLDGAWASGEPRGALHCVPVLLKDQVETADMPTTYGSVLFADFVSHRDATLVRRLKDEGALILAKTNMGEFASRYVGSAFGIIRNPYDPTRNPSGSSGGSSAGAAASFGLVAIGEDTAGSIRGPAAVANLVGLRPTLELVSTHGMMPANPTHDTMGPITRTVTDAARVLDAIAGYDPADPITARAWRRTPETYTAFLRDDALEGARIGVVRAPMSPGTEPDSDDYAKVRAVMDRAVTELGAAGAVVVDSIAIEEIALLEEVWNEFETEAATDAYLAELRDPPYASFADILLSGRVNPWRARGMMSYAGKTTDDPGYLTVTKNRAAVRAAVLAVMAEHDLDALAYATFDHQPQPIAPDVETNPAPDDRYGWGDNRQLSPGIGFPALTLPAGFTSDDLPVGLELLSRPFTEGMLLGLGYAYEQSTGHRRPPSATPALPQR
jgi:Asp-tRNA(Asn)/Glu-tRNA(Gln) amidotransferase A subunit family amidase